MIHPLADVQTGNIGENTRVWQYCVILESAVIGNGCNICSHVFIEDDVFIGPNVTFCNDRHPKSGNKGFVLERVIIRRGVVIGANATILPGVEIGRDAVVGAGSVVTKSVPGGVTVIGNPARVKPKG
jgi:acetyltransferase-like isoleucine patch superfamily enzyme